MRRHRVRPAEPSARSAAHRVGGGASASGAGASARPISPITSGSRGRSPWADPDRSVRCLLERVEQVAAGDQLPARLGAGRRRQCRSQLRHRGAVVRRAEGDHPARPGLRPGRRPRSERPRRLPSSRRHRRSGPRRRSRRRPRPGPGGAARAGHRCRRRPGRPRSPCGRRHATRGPGCPRWRCCRHSPARAGPVRAGPVAPGCPPVASPTGRRSPRRRAEERRPRGRPGSAAGAGSPAVRRGDRSGRGAGRFLGTPSRHLDRIPDQGYRRDGPEQQGQVAAVVLSQDGLAGGLAALPVDQRDRDDGDQRRRRSGRTAGSGGPRRDVADRPADGQDGRGQQPVMDDERRDQPEHQHDQVPGRDLGQRAGTPPNSPSRPAGGADQIRMRIRAPRPG